MSSSLLLFPQCFGRYILLPSSGVCRTQEPSWNFELATFNLQMIVTLEAQRTNAYNCYTKCPAGHCGNNNKDEDNSPKNLNDKNQQASSQKFRQLVCRHVMHCFIVYVIWNLHRWTCNIIKFENLLKQLKTFVVQKVKIHNNNQMVDKILLGLKEFQWTGKIKQA